MIVKQIKVGNMDVYCYILGCEKTRDAAVIDPGGDIVKIISAAKKLNLNIKYIFNTHHHSDHTCGNGELKKITGAQVLIHKSDKKYLMQPLNIVKIGTLKFNMSPKPDILIEGDAEFNLGEIGIKIFHTPGHTPGGLCFYAEGNIFTGDTLFVGDSGRTDLPGGNRKELGASIRRLMKNLPDDTIINPGHDYGPTPTSTIKWEKRNNVNALEYGYYEE